MRRDSPRERGGSTRIEWPMAIAIIAVLIALLRPAEHAASEAARSAQCVNNFKQIGLALQNHHAIVGTSPWGRGPLGCNGRNFMALILGRVEQLAASHTLNFASQDGINGFACVGDVTNTTAARTRLSFAACSSDNAGRLTRPDGRLSCDANSGLNLAFFTISRGILPSGICATDPESPAIGIAAVVDGTSNTAAISERVMGIGQYDQRVMIGRGTPSAPFTAIGSVSGMTNPDAFRAACLSQGNPRMSGATPGVDRPTGAVWHMGNPNSTRHNHIMPPNTWSCIETSGNTNGAMTANSRHPGAVSLAMAEGSVRLVKNPGCQDVPEAIGSRNGGEILSADA